jgi:formiminotetrahydrofolate cyclodeaminase
MNKDNERLKGFLKDDLLKIQINLSEIKDQLNKYNYNSKEKEFENIEDILSYWFQHHKNL